MTAEQFLVIVLSTTLAVFLILAIWLVILLIKVANSLKKITDQAETVAENVANISRLVKSNIRPAIFSTNILQILNRFVKKRRKE